FGIHYGFPPLASGIQWTLDEGPAFEKGEYSIDEFWHEASARLPMPASDFAVFRKLWGDILFRNEEVLACMQALRRRPQTALIMVSNIDELRMGFVLDELGLGEVMHTQVGSYESGVDFKGPGVSTMWQKARALATQHLGVEPQTIVGIDDLPGNLERASQDETLTHAIAFQGAKPLREELTRLGLLPAHS
ncbi:MAG: hypothetical protein HOM34_02205, partial [Planctomycetes bacterium]|nr:hypothetical protein [Planctomycetota bacterium]